MYYEGMVYFADNIEKLTLENDNFRKVIFTGQNTQLVLMSIAPGEDIGEEVHNVDQFFRIEQGTAKFILGNTEILAEAEHAVIVTAGTKHNVINTGSESLKLYTLYSPPNHPPDTVHQTKKEASEAEQEEHSP